MDNSYISINIDVSPDIVTIVQSVVLLGSLLYLSHRVLKVLEPAPAPSAPKRANRA